MVSRHYCKRVLSTLLMSALILVGFMGVAESVSADSAQYRISTYNYGEWDGIHVDWDPVGSSATMDVRVKQYGIHTGEQAKIRWKLYRSYDGALLNTRTVSGDFDGYLTYYNLSQGDYQITWESLTNNDTEGYMGVPSAYADTYQ
ncbi:MAG: hypothetical protein WAM07_01825 [Halobacillus sp.]|uniref:Uncharacterized protein n=1 Tax=Halobacillus halophilus (strain ATCC 35676 / DSM 2266 / JCM 20832 / KCTC 3685 / LMG 17431 / NBRC 102448 / NCIMB 2269) TaxID=866895 RepID=I0JL10_HALH3|nr:hypothetical protein [Halobacillus halophilus]ASF38950.1 hypothetical protein CEH05_07425 [Halobacillus halophilus]CCG44830.1 hypothetical protein HBHAL_2487 [Halobacillus halophilus DSM 2266]